MTTAFWPAISARSSAATVGFFEVGRRLADAHVEHDLVEARNLHLVLVAELLLQRLADGLVVDRLEARLCSRCLSH